MWNKKIIVTNHAKQRFEERNIKFSRNQSNPIFQILFDLRPLNVRKRENLGDNNYKVTTNQGKVYIIVEHKHACFVKTVYKTNLQYDLAIQNTKLKRKVKQRNENN